MPRACSICKHPDSAAITKALGREGGSLRGVAARFNLTHSSVLRHKSNCMGIKSVREPKPEASQASRRRGARAGDDAAERFATLEPTELIRGVACLVGEALDLLESAKESGDLRTRLAALREARDGHALLMKAAGMLAGDSAGSVTINAQQQAIAFFGRLDDNAIFNATPEQIAKLLVAQVGAADRHLLPVSGNAPEPAGAVTIEQAMEPAERGRE